MARTKIIVSFSLNTESVQFLEWLSSKFPGISRSELLDACIDYCIECTPDYCRNPSKKLKDVLGTQKGDNDNG